MRFSRLLHFRRWRDLIGHDFSRRGPPAYALPQCTYAIEEAIDSSWPHTRLAFGFQCLFELLILAMADEDIYRHLPFNAASGDDATPTTLIAATLSTRAFLYIDIVHGRHLYRYWYPAFECHHTIISLLLLIDKRFSYPLTGRRDYLFNCFQHTFSTVQLSY